MNPELPNLVKHMVIHGGREPTLRKGPISYLATAAVVLACKLPQLDQLIIADAEWQPWTMHKNVFLYLPVFTAVTCLRLHNITFPSIVTFGCLVCSLPGLTTVVWCDLTFTHDTLDQKGFDIWHNRTKIKELCLHGSGIKEVAQFMVSTGIGAGLQEIFLRQPADYQDSNRVELQQLLDLADASLSVLHVQLDEASGRQLTVKNADRIFLHSHSAALRYLTLSLPISAADTSSIDWILAVLREVRSEKLEEIELCLDIRSCAKDVRLQSILDMCDSAACIQVDNILSSDKFKNLTRIEFQIKAASCSKDTPEAKEWESQLAPRFWKLVARDIFRATVTVDMHFYPAAPITGNKCSLAPPYHHYLKCLH